MISKRQLRAFDRLTASENGKSEGYREAHSIAQGRADATGFDIGLEWLGGRWNSFMLPRRESRFGRDLNCEVVSCSDLARCQHGHGPLALSYEQILAAKRAEP